MHISLNNSPVSFKRYFADVNEELKQFELNRNKSLNYVLDKNDLDFVDFLHKERAKGFSKNFHPKIVQRMGEICFDRCNNITENDTFNFSRIVRGIGKKEIDALKQGKQIYSQQRIHLLGVDVTNYPNGIGFGEYLLKFKDKPNLDHYISDCYHYQFEKENVPHISGWGTGGSDLSHHSILCGTYTINDVEQIVDLKTNEIVYDQNEENIPQYEHLLNEVHSKNPEEIINAVEKLQTYYGDGRFMDDIEFLLNSENPQVQEAYLNAFYNYGKGRSLENILQFEKNSKTLDNIVISRIANCIEKFGEIEKSDNVIHRLLLKVCANKNDKYTIYAFKNIADAIRETKFARENNAPILEQYVLQEKSLALKAIGISALTGIKNHNVEKISKHIELLKNAFDFNNDTSYSDELHFLNDAIRFYELRQKFNF